MTKHTTPAPDKIRVFHAMLAKANLMSQKESILSGYDVTSTKQLTAHQLDELINWLNGEINRQVITERDWKLFDARNPQHRYILSLCHQLAWVVFDSKTNRHIADMDSLATWLKHKSKYKLPIMKLTYSQLTETIYQLERVVETAK